MVLFNYATKEITAKIVYYGPGLCGKTTNLQFIHSKLDADNRGKLLSLATETDRTLFFDFLPVDLGSVGGFHVRFQLYTVPGQVHYNATRKMVLKGVDAVVFVADSQIEMMEKNRESFENLKENLAEIGYNFENIPIALQCNKRDLPNIAAVEDIAGEIGAEGYETFEAVANRGDGVFETLKAIIKLSVARLKGQFREEGIQEPDMAGLGAPAAKPARYEPKPLFSPDTPLMARPSEGGSAGEETAAPSPDEEEREVFDLDESGEEEGSWTDIMPRDRAGDAGAEGREPFPEGAEASPGEDGEILLEEEIEGGADDVEEFGLEEMDDEITLDETNVEPVLPAEAPAEAPPREADSGLAARVEEIAFEISGLREENRMLREGMKRIFEGLARQVDILRAMAEEGPAGDEPEGD